MPAYLLNTDILIDFLRGSPEAHQLMQRLESEGAFPTISTVSVTELLAGLKSGEEEATESFLSILVKIPVSEDVARSAGLLLGAYRKSHALELADGLVAATAITQGATLVTRNVKHYPMPRLKKLRPYYKILQ